VTTSDPIPSAFSRLDRLGAVASTNDVVRDWLAAGVPEVCVAVADEQSAGRGRMGRTWTAPAGAALLLSAGFRPTWLEPDRAWRVGATVALAMSDAAEEAAGLPEGAIRLKWPNDLVIETRGPHAVLAGIDSTDEALARLAGPLELRKLAGVLGESRGLGTDDPQVVIGIGINADWAASGFPPELGASMTSLREASTGRPIDREVLLVSFLDHLDARLEALRAGFFDHATWTGRQALTGCRVAFEEPGGITGAAVIVDGVDAASGALVVHAADDPADAAPTLVHAGEVVRVLLAGTGV
jgi:BirA family transcriptional regulator, biotin operon repressor / biotin---[acetyl-CoA-carboxylase] ligase